MIFSPLNFGIGTNVNGQSNYQVDMNVDPGLFNAAQEAYNSILNSNGGTGAYSGGGFFGGGGSVTGQLDQGPVSQQVQREQLMSDQLNQLLAKDSPYIRQARRQGEALASRRGLMNSAIAGGASVGAAIDRAAPIAQFDASRYGSVADQNMAAEAAHREQMARTASAGAGAQASMASAAAQREHDINRMLFGHQLGALDDYRRHMLGIETREDTQSFQGGQADIDRMRDDSRFWGHQALLNLHQAGLQDRQFQHGSYMDLANLDLNRANLANNAFFQGQGMLMNPILGIYNNPNLTAEQQNAAVQNWMRQAPGFAQQGGGLMPPWMQGYQPSFVNPSAWQAAGSLPPLPPISIGR